MPSSEAAIALWVALAQVGRMMAATNSTRWFAIIGLRNGDDCPEQHKGRVDGEQPGPLAPLASAGRERADKLAVPQREASLNTTCI